MSLLTLQITMNIEQPDSVEKQYYVVLPAGGHITHCVRATAWTQHAHYEI